MVFVDFIFEDGFSLSPKLFTKIKYNVNLFADFLCLFLRYVTAR